MSNVEKLRDRTWGTKRERGKFKAMYVVAKWWFSAKKDGKEEQGKWRPWCVCVCA